MLYSKIKDKRHDLICILKRFKSGFSAQVRFKVYLGNGLDV